MYDVIIIGGGPAGLMAANVLKDKNVILLEKGESVGRKLLLSGGGRCNMTNLKPNHEFMEKLHYNKKFLYSTIANFGPQEVYDYFLAEIELKEEKDNQIFPKSNRSKDVLEVLTRNVANCIRTQQAVSAITMEENTYTLTCGKDVYKAKAVIVATGGASYKMCGSSGDHMQFAKQLQQPTIPLFPAETSILLKQTPNLAGTSFPTVEVSFLKKKIQGNLMFTHKGMSGTAIMEASEFIHQKQVKEIFVDFMPSMNEEALREHFEQQRNFQMMRILGSLFTKRFSEYLLQLADIDMQMKGKQVLHKQMDRLIACIKSHQFEVFRVEDIEKAYVSGGGIATKYLQAKTMESRIHKNLFFVGECVDIHGPIGGYNITLALSTGYSAAKELCTRFHTENDL